MRDSLPAPSTYALDRVSAAVAAIFAHAGSTPEEAAIVARNLVDAEATGHASHGLCQVPIYIDNVAAGRLAPNRHARIVRDDAPFLVADGDLGYGQVIAREATDLAVARARSGGASILAIRNAHHIGRVGSYGEQAIRAGLAAAFFVNVVSRPQQSPFGGIRPRLGTNPICIAVPETPRHPPLLLDFATSAVAVNKCRVAMNAGEEMADGLLIDPEGRPTRDPNVMYSTPSGAILPFGGHKGSGLALVCEILGGVIAAGLPSLPANLKPGKIVNNVLAFVFDPARVAEGAWGGLADEVYDYVGGTPPAEGVARVLLPGAPERENRLRAARSGLAIAPETLAALRTVATRRGLDLDALLAD